MSITIQNVTKNFGSYRALSDVSLEIEGGELLALLGPSGSGKTTLLRIIAGLETQDSGLVAFHGSKSANPNVKERNVGFVFQHYALFRHMTVLENVSFGLRVQPKEIRPSKKDIEAKSRELLRLVMLDNLADRLPSELSGGQRQRVALARALAVEPKVLLLDEPFGALDAKVRKELRRWLRRLHDEMGITSVFVTHDQEEALEVADRIIVMNEGRIEQLGTPDEVYNNPASSFVYNFLGNVNLFHGRVSNGVARIGDISFESPEHALVADAPALGYSRPHEIDIDLVSLYSDSLESVVKKIKSVGPTVRIELDAAHSDEPLEVELSRGRFDELALKVGDRVFAHPRNVKVFVNDFCI